MEAKCECLSNEKKTEHSSQLVSSANKLATQKNYEKARKLYEEAITVGDSDALTGLGILYFYGQGIEQDFLMAKQLFKSAVELGNPRAMKELGFMYQYNLGGEQDFNKVKSLYEKAVELGNLDAVQYLAAYYVSMNQSEKAKELWKSKETLLKSWKSNSGQGET